MLSIKALWHKGSQAKGACSKQYIKNTECMAGLTNTKTSLAASSAPLGIRRQCRHLKG